MSPILVRPVREQLEHDRVIRLLQAKYKRKFDVGINPGLERLVPAGSGASAVYPDLVLQSSRKGRRLVGVIEVETAESVNHLEAMSQWVAYGRLRAPFFLYVPTSSIDPARRMCADMGIAVAELWAYHVLGEQMRFTLVQRSARAFRARTAAKKGALAARPRAPARKKPASSSRTRTKTVRRPTANGAARKTTRTSVKKTARKAAKKLPVKKKAAARPRRAASAGRAKTASSRSRKRR